MKYERSIFFGVLVVKICVLAIFVFTFGPARLIWSDSNTYLGLGENIFKGNGFSLEANGSVGSYVPQTVRTPLYPFVLGFFNASLPYGLVFVSFLQAIAAAFSALLIYRIARRFLGVGVSVGAALIVSCEPLISIMHLLIMPETFLLMFLLLFVYYFLEYIEKKNRLDFIISASSLALAMYTKPIAVYLLALPFLVLVFQKKGVLKAFSMVGIIMLLLSPWMLRNYRVAGVFDVTTDDVGNLCSWELAGILATRYKIDSSDFTAIYVHPEYERALEKCTGTFAAFKMFITDYPKDFAVTTAISAASMLTNEGYSAFFEPPPDEQVKIHHNYLTPAVLTNSDWKDRVREASRELSRGELFAVIAGKVFWAFVAFFAFCGVLMGFLRSRSVAFWVLLLFVLYFILATTTTTAYGVGSRLRFPINPFLIIFAFYGLSQLIQKNVSQQL